MSECTTCGGYGSKHDPIVHDAEPECEHEWLTLNGWADGDLWDECCLCGQVKQP